MEHDRSPGIVLRTIDATRIRTVVETGSTNADLLGLAQTGAVEGSWLRAERQSAGRGRLGREWRSPHGNLYASTLVRLRNDDPAAPTLALVAAVSVEEAVGVFLHVEKRLKWPNDLLVGNAKLSGILLERIGNAVVIGFGVNVAHHPKLPDRPTTSLSAHGVIVAPDLLLQALVESFDRWICRWRSEGLRPILNHWIERAHPIGSALQAHLPDGSRLDGVFDGLDPTGALMLRLAGGERRVIHAGDVFLI